MTHQFFANKVCRRADVFLSESAEISRSRSKTLLDSGAVTINGKTAKADTSVNIGDEIIAEIPKPEPLEIVAENLPISIVYEDDDIAVVDKPKGMATHPAPGNFSGTLVNALLFHLKNLSGINGVLRPGIVHRIDKDTTGLLVVAKNDAAHVSLAEQIEKKQAKRQYLCLVFGDIDKSGTVNEPIGRSNRDRKKMAVKRDGKPAVTHYTPMQRFGDYTLLSVQLETGRTHQIRVHLAYIGHPVCGDEVYTKRKFLYETNGQMLHAEKLTLAHPRTGEVMSFTAPLPEYFERIVGTRGNVSSNSGITVGTRGNVSKN